MKREIIFSKKELIPKLSVSLGTAYKRSKEGTNFELINIIYNPKENKLGYNYNVHLPKPIINLLNNLDYDMDYAEILEDLGIFNIKRWHEFSESCENIGQTLKEGYHELHRLVKSGEFKNKENGRKYTSLKTYNVDTLEELEHNQKLNEEYNLEIDAYNDFVKSKKKIKR